MTAMQPIPSADSKSTLPGKPGMTRVMLVDDSLTVRTVFSRMIANEPDFSIVGQAGTAEKALMMLRSNPADVILLDLEMPGMGGLEALPKLLQTSANTQVLVVSSLTAEGAEMTMKALQIGAADTMLKPRPGGFNDDYRTTLLEKIRALGGSASGAGEETPADMAVAGKIATKRPAAIAIGASTGGIHALNLLLRRLPAQFNLPILITQHLPESFLPVFARQMEAAANRETILAQDGVKVSPGRIIIAPGHAHMMLRRQAGEVFTTLAFHDVPSGCRPSVDPMLESVAEIYEGRAAAILLSGMGRDGTAGAIRLAEAGGAVLAQDEASSAVWGMPRSVAQAGVALAVLPPAELADKIVDLAKAPA